MRRVTVVFTIATLALMLLAPVPVAAAGGTADVVTGQGTYGVVGVHLVAVSNPGGTFGFIDAYRADTGNPWLSADVDCVYVDGNTAFVSGPMRGNPSVNVVIVVEDNGNGSTSEPDRLAVHTGNVDCDYEPFHNVWRASLKDMDSGNMVVK